MYIFLIIIPIVMLVLGLIVFLSKPIEKKEKRSRYEHREF
jgi:hypothetical protein